ncbi:hypothetical protein B0T49_21805 [Chromobacterium violaceum]|uniref:WYL domain-containing protein n=1 Tax=Chromobacterium violaceum TaxID=536 RepID=UPI0009F025BD|nr:WYL domain-containing protein [Chromobacterium violaceum]OQS45193.1 hypothetical protein B0T49_21805 [Chromobacterium violaceum]OQS45777.1 hypothetical protein B0T48_17975 [Chromobacterium violaceum]
MDKEHLICKAILEKRVLAFYYDGHYRTVEPHAYGTSKGGLYLLGYQLTGKSRSGQSLGWRQFKVDHIAYMQILTDGFTSSFLGSEPKNWERYIALVE